MCAPSLVFCAHVCGQFAMMFCETPRDLIVADTASQERIQSHIDGLGIAGPVVRSVEAVFQRIILFRIDGQTIEAILHARSHDDLRHAEVHTDQIQSVPKEC